MGQHCTSCNGGGGESNAIGGGTADKAEYDDTSITQPFEIGELSQKLEFLSKVPLFRPLGPDLLEMIADSLVQVEYMASDTIIRQGDVGFEFFVIQSGFASVNVMSDGEKDGKKVASLSPGDYFGEQALLFDDTRAATITAETPLRAFKLSRAKFEDLGLKGKLEFGKRKAVGAGAARKVEGRGPSPKTEEESNLIQRALRANENLNAMVTLDDKRLTEVTRYCWKQEVEAGKEVITAGALNADFFYIVQDGAFDVILPSSGGGESAESKINAQIEIAAGGSFGELALLYYAPRAATVKAKVKSTVWVLDRTNFKQILMSSAEDTISRYVTYLERIEILAPLLKDEKVQVAQALVEVEFLKDELITEQGQCGDHVYILYEGETTVFQDGKEKCKMSASPNQAQIFGERALLLNEPRSATVKVTSEVAKTLTIDRATFNMMLCPLEDLTNRGERSNDVAKKSVLVPSTKNRPAIPRDELVVLGLLGCGGFGAVELVEHTKTQATYALKRLSKGYVVSSGNQEQVMSEKRIQWECDSPFIIMLYQTYNTDQNLYFLLELALGGELYATYHKKNFFGLVRHAMYYVAGTTFAFEHLHSKKFIYRDLKPENLLLTELGHVKLTDMGLAKYTIGTTYTTCGTPDYFAPEIIAGTGHNFAVDWWMLGILIYELMVGHPPFEANAPTKTYNNIKKGIMRVQFPAKCRGAVEDLIKCILKREAGARLPMRPGGVNNIKKHKWFANFDWDALLNASMAPPYVPTVKNKKDPSNFSANVEDLPPHVRYEDDGSGWDAEFAS
eukprot:TRINITY_DN3231_c0_g1_i1.p1 TRINITY_DN3231_c0_g1~~TRINITY_DN3231_c0_g1_i1.p1  ORF type:complete len:791 (-),score=234.88 TRINITY_DN3231_c0_g1_i1:226-2598(-)